MKRIKSLLLPSLLIGTLVTLLFTSSMTWRTNPQCSDNMYNALVSRVRRIDCSGMEYGHPYKFIYAQPFVDVGQLSEQENAPITIGASAIIKLNGLKLAADVLIW